MNRLVLALVLVTGTRLAAANATFSDNSKVIAHDCAKDPEVAVLGNDNAITLTGTCAKVIVAGNKNKVTAASAKDVGVTGNDNAVTVAATDHLSATGNSNAVTWKAGIAGPKPAITNTGRDNKIAQRK